MSSDRLEKWKTIVEIWDKEADRYWMRNNIFLIVNSALLIVISSSVQNFLLCMIVSIFGIIFSFYWYRINLMGKYYLDRWKFILDKLEINDDINIFGVELQKIQKSFKEPMKYKATSTYMRYVNFLFAIMWFILFIFYIISIINPFLFTDITPELIIPNQTALN